MKVIKNYKFRCYPNKKTADYLDNLLEKSRMTYNHLVYINRKLIYENESCILGYDLNKYTDSHKKEIPGLSEIPSFARNYIVKRISEAFKEYFKGTRGKPRYKKSKNSYRSITFPYYAVSKYKYYGDNWIRLPKIGKIRTIFHRKLPNNCVVRTISLKKTSTNKWYVIFTIEFEIEFQSQNNHVDRSNNIIGIDFGCDYIVNLSNGTRIEAPKFYDKELRRLRVLSRSLSRKKKGSKNFEKARLKLTKLHERITNRRLDFHHKLSKKIANNYDIICLENLKLKEMSENSSRYAKSLRDNAIGILKNLIIEKATFQGKIIQLVDPKNTSKTCSKCKSIQDMPIWTRVFECKNCGYIQDRDINASINMVIFSGLERPVEPVERIILKGDHSQWISRSEKQEAIPL